VNELAKFPLFDNRYDFFHTITNVTTIDELAFLSHQRFMDDTIYLCNGAHTKILDSEG